MSLKGSTITIYKKPSHALSPQRPGVGDNNGMSLQRVSWTFSLITMCSDHDSVWTYNDEMTCIGLLAYNPVLFLPLKTAPNIEEITHIGLQPEEGLLNNMVNLVLSEQWNYVTYKENKKQMFVIVFLLTSTEKIKHLDCLKLHSVTKLPHRKRWGLYFQLVDQSQ